MVELLAFILATLEIAFGPYNLLTEDVYITVKCSVPQKIVTFSKIRLNTPSSITLSLKNAKTKEKNRKSHSKPL